MKEGKMIAMLLAGGQGSRLKLLTKDIAKPAVPFGGKYRIIDFPLSNCSNSGIFDVGILTQYKPYRLNSHIGIGGSWDLDRRIGGVRVLPPYTSEKGGRWYKGTANAIFENISYIDELDPEYVLILSGDHIYKMDYSKMLDFHEAKKAEVTISVIEVPWEETSRFGIINVDDTDTIVAFEEKPKNAKSNLASMGIYIFNWKTLRKYLVADEKDQNSSNDFGKDVIPKLNDDGKKLVAYRFDGYWKDVGTIRSYWEANMDLLSQDNTLNLYDRKWKIYTRNRHLPPHFVACNASVRNSLINEGCFIEGDVCHSVLFSEITIKPGAKIHNCVVLPGAVIEEDAVVYNAVIMENVVIKAGSSIGDAEDDNVYLISKSKIIES
ncbi:glucose-1-phosphate adenylyltransferase [Fusibacter paucivorans]|uniref:Glucose-1-phosphate adenylyltransferase n=1 Tax=Fusibacter paucivorans TaxID=76009 RepID=A0ABS5PRK4_9FIRM|nr:glucose-1-phosphate adenylyltransferase [Fusibacter paucivorans]MBS7527789.1 glucose-1-phosphate adenylyltransferase [Fusibacter paucivorans]